MNCQMKLSIRRFRKKDKDLYWSNESVETKKENILSQIEKGKRVRRQT